MHANKEPKEVDVPVEAEVSEVVAVKVTVEPEPFPAHRDHVFELLFVCHDDVDNIQRKFVQHFLFDQEYEEID